MLLNIVCLLGCLFAAVYTTVINLRSKVYINLVNAFCREMSDKNSSNGDIAFNYLRMIYNGSHYIHGLLKHEDQDLARQIIPIARRMVKSVNDAYSNVCCDDFYIRQKYKWDDERIKRFRTLYTDVKRLMSVLKTISNNYTYMGTSPPFKDLINMIKSTELKQR